MSRYSVPRQIEFVDLGRMRRARRKTFVDAEAVVEPGIVDETLQPTVVRGFSKYTRITMISGRRARAFAPPAVSRSRLRRRSRESSRDHDDGQAVIAPLQHAVNRMRASLGCGRWSLGGRKFPQTVRRWRQSVISVIRVSSIGRTGADVVRRWFGAMGSGGRHGGILAEI